MLQIALTAKNTTMQWTTFQWPSSLHNSLQAWVLGCTCYSSSCDLKYKSQGRIPLEYNKVSSFNSINMIKEWYSVLGFNCLKCTAGVKGTVTIYPKEVERRWRERERQEGEGKKHVVTGTVSSSSVQHLCLWSTAAILVCSPLCLL